MCHVCLLFSFLLSPTTTCPLLQDSHSSLNFSPIVTSPNHVTISESESEDNVKEKEHLSPVSVLDAPFSEDATNQPGMFHVNISLTLVYLLIFWN